jgi:hypothetical protein
MGNIARLASSRGILSFRWLNGRGTRYDSLAIGTPYFSIALHGLQKRSRSLSKLCACGLELCSRQLSVVSCATTDD